MEWVRQPTGVRRRLAEEKTPRAYLDDGLRKGRRLYREFIKEGLRRGLLVIERRVREKIGIFCVKKKDGRQRLVADCRRSNVWFESAP